MMMMMMMTVASAAHTEYWHSTGICKKFYLNQTCGKHEKKIWSKQKQLTSTWDFQKVVALFFFLAVTSVRQTFGSWQNCNWLCDASAHWWSGPCTQCV